MRISCGCLIMTSYANLIARNFLKSFSDLRFDNFDFQIIPDVFGVFKGG